MDAKSRVALGLDFGTESVRAVLVDLAGQERAAIVDRYPHGQITEALPTTAEPLPPTFALQHPRDWTESAAKAVQRAVQVAGITADDVIGIGVDFTSCTMLPTLRDGTPLCLIDKFAARPQAWPKLWKHHHAGPQTERMNQLALQRGEKFLDRYGGCIGLEWFFPKALETLDHDPETFAASEVWLEAGDWFVWQLVGGSADNLPRSTCQAGYKALWSPETGYASPGFLAALDPRLQDFVSSKMMGRLLSPGTCAGVLTPEMAQKLGLRPGIPVSTATIDAHSAVPGTGAADAGTLVMVLGTSSCHMLNAEEFRPIAGVTGVVAGGILPGLFGYETGQAAVGDAFDWLRRLLGHDDFVKLDERAAQLSPGSDGVSCVDWMNGCRTPLMDGSLRGMFNGLALHHHPEHLYRALLEASGFGLRWIVELFRTGGVPVHRFTATGGLPHHTPMLVPIYADVLGEPISICPSPHGSALGAAILGANAAGPKSTGFANVSAAITAMATPRSAPVVVQPNPVHRQAYDEAYWRYRQQCDQLRG